MYILILQSLLPNKFLRLLMSWDTYGGPQVIPYNEFQKDAEKHYDISERDRSDFKSYEKTGCYINYKGSMERKSYWLKTGLREAYRTKGRLHHELFCLY